MGEPVRTSPATRREPLELLRIMLEIRFFEDACHRLFAQGVVRGSTHLCQGQEATIVGACDPLRDGDAMLCTYRGHGAVLAMGAPLDRCFGEILGKEAGVCGGKGGSMHLTDTKVGALGSFAIIGAHLPIAVGSALAARYRGSDAVTLCFFGDGTANIGAFHEALNLAALWKVPAIFLCENNLYGEYSPIAATTAIEDLVDRADSYSMAKARIDGNDLDEVRAAAAEAVERARAGDGPTFIESLTYRHKGHSRSDPAAYRPEGELEAWLERDPIVLYERKLLEGGAPQEDLDAIRGQAEQAVDQALARAHDWPEPDPEARFEHVFA
jgi:acetoin:2,6-dichlorophenolindophenol oxidoreductase subunit alpha